MNSAAKAIAAHGLKRRALSLGAVKAFDHALHFLLPVVLVRALDTATFGEYRLLWLAVGTVMAVATLNMCGSLYFFLPRSDAPKKRLYIHHTLVFLAVSGLICGLAVSPWNPLLPAPMRPLGEYGALVPAFVALWVAAILLDYLPTIDERIAWQGYATVGVTALRGVLVAAGAVASGELRLILWLLLASVVLKLAILLFYIARHHGLGRPWFDRGVFAGQVGQSVPFGISNALFSLRAQADQWVAASLFALSSFAAFSIAGVVGQVVHIFRHSVMEAFMPAMSRMEAAGDVGGMMEMNRRANALVGLALFPILAAAFAFADEAVTIVYTASYLEAAPVMRLYVVGMAVMVIEVGSVILLLQQGPFAVKVYAAALAVSVAASVAAASVFGLTGAAAGSVLAIFLDRAATLRRVSRLTGIAFAQLQDWRGLAWSLGTASLAGALAWAVAPQGHALLRVVIGTAVLAAAYAAMNYRKFLR
jgi:O-antigen/teichoic acid export membrane protein